MVAREQRARLEWPLAGAKRNPLKTSPPPRRGTEDDATFDRRRRRARPPSPQPTPMEHLILRCCARVSCFHRAVARRLSSPRALRHLAHASTRCAERGGMDTAAAPRGVAERPDPRDRRLRRQRLLERRLGDVQRRRRAVVVQGQPRARRRVGAHRRRRAVVAARDARRSCARRRGLHPRRVRVVTQRHPSWSRSSLPLPRQPRTRRCCGSPALRARAPRPGFAWTRHAQRAELALLPLWLSRRC